MLDVARIGRRGSNGMVSWSGDASTGFWVDPKENLIGLALAQVNPNALIHLEMMDPVYRALED